VIDSLHGTLYRKEPMSIVVDVHASDISCISRSRHTTPFLRKENRCRCSQSCMSRRMRCSSSVFLPNRNAYVPSAAGHFRHRREDGCQHPVGLRTGSTARVRQNRQYWRFDIDSGHSRKTAERIIVELKDKLSKTVGSEPLPSLTGSDDRRSEALKALVALGYSRQTAEQSLYKALQSCSPETGTSELIK